MKLRLVNKQSEASDVKTFIFEPGQPLNWQPGQYLHYKLPHPNPDERKTERWFTIAAAPFEGHVQITTRFAAEHGSSFKAALDKLTIGQTVEAAGPSGDFVVEDPDLEYVFIAGGIGITPFRSILLQLDHDKQPINVELLYANRNDELVFGRELEALAKRQPNFKINPYIDPKRLTEDELKTYVERPKQPLFYVSGPEAMAVAFKEMLLKLGVDETRIKLDDFPGY